MRGFFHWFLVSQEAERSKLLIGKWTVSLSSFPVRFHWWFSSFKNMFGLIIMNYPNKPAISKGNDQLNSYELFQERLPRFVRSPTSLSHQLAQSFFYWSHNHFHCILSFRSIKSLVLSLFLLNSWFLGDKQIFPRLVTTRVGSIRVARTNQFLITVVLLWRSTPWISLNYQLPKIKPSNNDLLVAITIKVPVSTNTSPGYHNRVIFVTRMTS